jgi:hypothetical protein
MDGPTRFHPRRRLLGVAATMAQTEEQRIEEGDDATDRSHNRHPSLARSHGRRCRPARTDAAARVIGAGASLREGLTRTRDAAVSLARPLDRTPLDLTAAASLAGGRGLAATAASFRYCCLPMRLPCFHRRRGQEGDKVWDSCDGWRPMGMTVVVRWALVLGLVYGSES